MINPVRNTMAPANMYVPRFVQENLEGLNLMCNNITYCAGSQFRPLASCLHQRISLIREWYWRVASHITIKFVYMAACQNT